MEKNLTTPYLALKKNHSAELNSDECKESIMASTSNPKQGRKRRVLTLEKKLDIIKELKGGKSQRCVSELHQVPKSTVADI